jgi:hypothetical protein
MSVCVPVSAYICVRECVSARACEREREREREREIFESQLLGLPPAFMLSLLDSEDEGDMFL